MWHPCDGVLALGSAAILCTGGLDLDVTRKEAWSFHRTISGVRLCWELEEPKGPKGPRPAPASGLELASARLLAMQG